MVLKLKELKINGRFRKIAGIYFISSNDNKGGDGNTEITFKIMAISF